MDLVSTGEVRRDHAERAKAKTPRKGGPGLSRVPGAKKGLLSVFLEPSLATLSDKAPSGDEWIHEIKFDGYRLQVRIDGRSVKLLTRKGLAWTPKFKPIAEALQGMALGSALLDGEVVVDDEAGVSSFVSLQADLKAERTDRLVFYAFDLLYLDGYDLSKVSLIERKMLLAGLLDDAPADSVIRLSAYMERDGEAMVRHACRLGLEGIVSKRKDRPYIGGRGTHWLKTKCSQRQELVIAGYVPSTISSKTVGSLVMGVYDKGALVHVGRVGTGFTEALARSLWRELDTLKRPTPPFLAKLSSDAARGVRWVEPKLVAEVELRGWTADGLLRHASFKGLREVKEPMEVVRESTAANPASLGADLSRFRLTHPDRVLWPDVDLTKQGLAEFYGETADWILPHIAGRPLALVRCPSGVGQGCFFQKHAWSGISKAVQRKTVRGEEVLFIEDLEGLMALVQSSCLEIHPWGSTLSAVEKPDRITMDLDPAEEVPWTALIEGAVEVRERLRVLGLDSVVKTTGGKGLRVVVPLVPKAGWEEVETFAQNLAEAMTKDSPDRFVATMSKHARRGRIFVDYLRNGRGATAVAAYSTRARTGAPVSTPIAWEELSSSIRPNHFTVENLPTRLQHLKAGPWPDLKTIEQALPSLGSWRRSKR